MKVKVGKVEVDVMDALCPFRPCFHLHQWMGTYTQGRGYNYAPRSQWYHHCQRRADHGCPDQIPEPDPERARCCHAPRVRITRPGRRLPQRQRCTTCGVWLTGFALEVARNHPLPELYPCRHVQTEKSLVQGWWECTSWKGGCGGFWDHRPEPMEEPQYSFEDFERELSRRFG